VLPNQVNTSGLLVKAKVYGGWDVVLGQAYEPLE